MAVGFPDAGVGPGGNPDWNPHTKNGLPRSVGNRGSPPCDSLESGKPYLLRTFFIRSEEALASANWPKPGSMEARLALMIWLKVSFFMVFPFGRPPVFFFCLLLRRAARRFVVFLSLYLLLFSIGEIAKALGVTRRIILHYEERGLIEPDKRDDATNNRYYTIDTFTKLRSIRSLQNLGLTLDEIRDYYNDSTDLMPLIRRMEEMRDQLNLNIEKLYERAKVSSAQVRELELPQQLIYRRTYRSDNVADKTVLLRNTALEAMRAHGTDITRRMYFIQFPIDRPAEVSFCVAVPPGSEGEYVETAAPMRAICIYHHGAYEELPAVGRQLLNYAKEHGLTPQGILRHTYLEGPPQHKDPAKFITQVILPIV